MEDLASMSTTERSRDLIVEEDASEDGSPSNTSWRRGTARDAVGRAGKGAMPKKSFGSPMGGSTGDNEDAAAASATPALGTKPAQRPVDEESVRTLANAPVASQHAWPWHGSGQSGRAANEGMSALHDLGRAVSPQLAENMAHRAFSAERVERGGATSRGGAAAHVEQGPATSTGVIGEKPTGAEYSQTSPAAVDDEEALMHFDEDDADLIAWSEALRIDDVPAEGGILGALAGLI